jgi:hypothetical protein
MNLPSNTKYGTENTTIPLLDCPFCDFKTPIEFDLKHRYQLTKRFQGKKFDNLLEYVLVQFKAAAIVRIQPGDIQL